MLVLHNPIYFGVYKFDVTQNDIKIIRLHHSCVRATWCQPLHYNTLSFE
jgi:hypothetical protein